MGKAIRAFTTLRRNCTYPDLIGPIWISELDGVFGGYIFLLSIPREQESIFLSSIYFDGKTEEQRGGRRCGRRCGNVGVDNFMYILTS